MGPCINDLAPPKEWDSWIIDVLGDIYINQHRDDEKLPFFFPTLALTYMLRWMDGVDTYTRDGFLNEHLKPILPSLVHAEKIFFPCFYPGHYWLCIVHRPQKTIHLWDTIENNRDGHIMHTVTVMETLAKELEKLIDEDLTPDGNWAKFGISEVTTAPIQADWSNDCGAWVCKLMLDSVGPYYRLRKNQQKISTDELRLDLLCRALMKDPWKEDDWEEMVTGAIAWATSDVEALPVFETTKKPPKKTRKKKQPAQK